MRVAQRLIATGRFEKGGERLVLLVVIVAAASDELGRVSVQVGFRVASGMFPRIVAELHLGRLGRAIATRVFGTTLY